MDRQTFLLYNMLLFTIFQTTAGHVHNATLAKNFPKELQSFSVIPGVKMYYKRGDVELQISLRNFFSKAVVEARGGGGGPAGGGGSGPAAAGSGGSGGGAGKKTGPLQKIIRAMMMIPFAMQLITLPGVLAEIKISLLKSLIIAKIALVTLIMNAIKSGQKKEVVVIQKLPPPQYHDHYYHPDNSEYEEENQGWFGR